MNSIWTKHIKMPRFQPLEDNTKTDVLIIGGGITGILCAYFLQEKGIDYILAEGRNICSGTTRNTTAKITAQHGLIYHKLIKSVGTEKAKMYLDSNLASVKKYYELCQNLDCDFEKKTSYIYSKNNRAKMEREAAALDKLGITPSFSDADELPFATAGAIGLPGQAQFHPLKLIAQLAPKLKIYEHTFVKKLSENTAITEKGKITFQRLIFATHFPIDNKHGMYFLKMYQDRSYVIALEHAAQLDGMYMDEDKAGISFRNYQDYLLLGSGSHRTGTKSENWKGLRKFASTYYPNAKETSYWAAQDCMSLDHIPYIGRYANRMSECFVASGFNKWGMTSSMTAAQILTDFIIGKENPYSPVFQPSRNMLKPQLLLNGLEAAFHLLTLTNRRCPHLGCALQWNPAEHTWDCPCHGSRFDPRGYLLDNPANGNLKTTRS